jgi:hypothetical protein
MYICGGRENLSDTLRTAVLQERLLLRIYTQHMKYFLNHSPVAH